MSKIVTANMLASGRVVFLGAEGAWVEAVEDATVFADDAAAQVGMAQAQRDQDAALIVEAFVATRTVDKAGAPAMSLRDVIRAHGPTVRFRPVGPTT